MPLRLLRHRVFAWAAAGLAAAVPPLICLAYIHRFGVDVVFWDQWDFVPLLQHWYGGQLTLSDLFAQHNEHRILFPRLVMLGTALLTGYDTVVEMYLSWFVAVGIGAVLLIAFLRHFGTSAKSLALFLPVSWVVFGLRQSENWLWGWQIQVFMCSLGVVGAAYCLERASTSPRWIVGGIASGIVASFSFSAGLVVWPAGIVQLILRHAADRKTTGPRHLFLAAGWLFAAAGTVLLYLWGYVRPGYLPDPMYFASHLQDGAVFALLTLGFPVERYVSYAFVAGVAVVALGMVATVLIALRKVDLQRTSFGALLIMAGLGCAALVTSGRAGLGPTSALVSRYTTLTGLILIGLYWVALSVRPHWLRRGFASVVVVVITLGAYDALKIEYIAGENIRIAREHDAAVLRAYRDEPDSEFRGLYGVPPWVRERAAVLEAHHLNVFRAETRVATP